VDAFSAILLALCVLEAIVATVFIARTMRSDRAFPRVREGDRLPPAPGLLSIVIPAHNEARVIEASVRGLRAQTRRNFEAIYVLDRCTDRTRDLLVSAAEGDPRIRFIENDSCPPDWAGKCNACRVGAAAATGEWLLFTDADCRFAPDLLDAMLAIAHARGTALLSAVGRLTFRRRFERFLQPVASVVLFRIFPPEKANRDQRRWPFANGQFLLFRREAYDAIGGHEAVKDALLEDLAFAWRLHRDGARLGLVDASRRMEVSMYDSLQAMRSGWTRIYIESCARRPDRLVKGAIELMVISVLLPAAAAFAAVFGSIGALDGREGSIAVAGAGMVSLALGFSAVAFLHQRQRAPLVGAVVHPVAAFMVARWLLDGARMLRNRVPIRWGGKEYVLEPRVGKRRGRKPAG
jgi:cellulose synthase/poly-beta-1,6-N-acetylglucosamine synthase-like glycosyltransferase